MIFTKENINIKNRYWHKSCWEQHLIKENQSVKAIEELEKYICDFLSEFITSVETYITNKHFKTINTPLTTAS